MAKFLWARRASWKLLTMGELLEDGDAERALKSLAAQEKLPMRRQEERSCPFIALPGTFDAYLNTLSSSTRYHIRRRTRDIEKKGGRIEVHEDPQEIVSRLEILIRLHLARWRKDGLPGTMARPGFAEFLRDICGNPTMGLTCRLHVLQHEGRPAAALLAFYWGQSALYYQAGWDPESPLSGLSPGVVLMAASIRDAIQSGLSYYEFLRGDEAYKSRWTQTHRTTATLLVGRGMVGNAYLGAARMKDIIKRSLRPNDTAARDGAAGGEMPTQASL
jgi:CelD/BcsL family acetyltransferase involved in cellulose biosynthesis